MGARQRTAIGRGEGFNLRRRFRKYDGDYGEEVKKKFSDSRTENCTRLTLLVRVPFFDMTERGFTGFGSNCILGFDKVLSCTQSPDRSPGSLVSDDSPVAQVYENRTIHPSVNNLKKI